MKLRYLVADLVGLVCLCGSVYLIAMLAWGLQ